MTRTADREAGEASSSRGPEEPPRARRESDDTPGEDAQEVHDEGYVFPLSFSQQRLWFLDQLTPGNPFYNLPIAVPIKAPVDRRVLTLAVNEIVRRHETLRTCVRDVDGEPHQIVLPFEPMQLPFEDLSRLPPRRREEEAARLALHAAVHVFRLDTAPLFRVKLLRLSTRSHVLFVTMHHMISDGWSMSIFWRELLALYADAAARRPPRLPDLAVQYGDFAEWQREWLSGDELERQLTYWREQLADLPTLALPTDRPRQAVARHRGAEQRITLSASLTRALHEQADRSSATLFMVLYAAFAILLARYAGQADIVVGTPIANRNRAELETVIGFFVNSLVLRLDLSGNPTFDQVVERARTTLIEALARQELPFERLVEELNVERDTSRNPLFQVTVQLFTPPGRRSGASRAEPELLEVSRGTAIFDLAANFWEAGDRIKGVIEYDSDLFEAETITRLCRHFSTLTAGLLGRPDSPVSTASLVADQERRRIAVAAEAIRSRVARYTPIWDVIRRRAQADSTRVAITDGVDSLDYAELVARASSIGARLQAEGVGPDVRVGILAERSIDAVAAVCGTMAAGACYVPLDVSLPVGRLRWQAAAAGCRVVLTDRSAPGSDRDAVHNTIRIEDAARTHPAELRRVSPARDHLAYTIYTSGSTGEPKGVAQRHGGLANLIEWMRATYRLTAEDVVLLKTPFAFDASVWEIFLPLVSDAVLAVAPPQAHRDPRALCRAVSDSRATVLQLVPSVLRLFLDDPAVADCRTLRLLFSGGEPLPSQLALIARETFPAVGLHNLYGPTETCIQSAAHDCEPTTDAGRSTEPIGRAIDGNGLYVVGPNLELQPTGVPGELWISGEGLARGYLNRPGQTAECFLPDPFSDVPGARIYRTGDRVRRLDADTLTFLGRLDTQVKIRGFRVELAEVESALASHPSVLRAAVTAAPDGGGSLRLVAHLEGEADDAQLRRYLSDRLPGYMVPSVFVVHGRLPLLASGKIDRGSLDDVDEVPTAAPITPPRDSIESAVLDIWASVLDRRDFGVEQDFFADLGGHSLLATQAVTRTRDMFQIEFPLHRIFERSTVADFVEALRADPSTGPQVALAERLLADFDESGDPEDAPLGRQCGVKS